MKKKRKNITAERAVLTSLFVDFLDVLLNAIAAFVTGSIVMLAETIQGVVDSISVGFVYIGLRRSKKPIDKKYPFGYGKAIYIWTFLAGIFMFGITAVVTFYLGLKRFLHPEEIKNIYVAIIVLSIFILSNGYSLSLGIRRILNGKRFKLFLKEFRKSELVETKTTLTLDLIGTTAAIFGLIALILYYLTGNLRFDGLGAMMVGLTLAAITFFLLNNIRQLLLGKRASPQVERRIINVIKSVKNVRSVPDLKTMNIGLGKILVNVEVSVNRNLKTFQIERLSDEIRERVKKEISEVSYIQIEIESPNKKTN